jgi:hypothetical protein
MIAILLILLAHTRRIAMVDVICGFLYLIFDLMKDCSSFQKISKVGTHEFFPFQSGF